MKYKWIILLAIYLIYVPSFVFAQSKPKRDTSKDRSVIVAKQQAKAKRQSIAQAAENKRKRYAEAQRKKQEKKVLHQVNASYLYVDNQTSLTKIVGPKRGSENFYVKTDGKDWSISLLPTWCDETKFSNYFTISYNENLSHDDRTDWFLVKSGNQEVKVYIKQNGTPLNISSSIDYAYLTHDVTRNVSGYFGSQFLKIDAKVTIQGAKGQKCFLVAFVSDEFNNYKIKASAAFPNYGLQSSQDVYVANEIVPDSDRAQSYDVTLYLPNNAMRLWKKKNKLNCQLKIYCEKTATYVSKSDYLLPFVAKNKKGKITTKKI